MEIDGLFSIAGRTAVVTGGARGIGSMIAEGLVAAGARVAIVGRTRTTVDARAAELATQGECRAITADVSTAAGCRAVADRVVSEFGGLDILVNNAGAQSVRPLEDFDDEQWDLALDVNLKAVFRLTRDLAPALRAGGASTGRVINIGSIDGLRVPPRENYAYAASKAAVHHLTRLLAKRLAPEILVNAIAPGPFDTDMARGIMREVGVTSWAVPPAGHVGALEDVVGAVIFLASEASRYVTGAVIPVDGGVATLL